MDCGWGWVWLLPDNRSVMQDRPEIPSAHPRVRVAIA